MTLVQKIKYKTYPSYKDSGVEWLDEVPEGWLVIPGLTILFENKEKNTGMKRNTVLSLSYGKIRVKAEEELTGLVPESFETYQLVNKGDIIFRPTDLQNDKVSLRSGMAEDEGIITSAYLNLRFKPIANKKFYSYLFRAIDNNKVIYGLGSGLRQNIDYRDFRRFLFPFPPLPEQTAIANFLDNKTTKIDRAIAQKQRLIELLKERKQILIQNAVTGKVVWSKKHQKFVPLALSEVKSKDSGVEWIGEIPEGWEVSVLKYLTSINQQSLPENTNKDLMFDYVDIGSVSYTKGIEKTERFSFKDSPSRARRIASFGNTIISSVRTYLKAIDFVSEEKSSYIYSTGFAILQPKTINNKFLYHFVRSDAFTEQVTVNSKGMSYPAINSTDLGKLWLAVPPSEEQKQIVTYIKTQSTKIDRAIALQQTQIEKLKEYKSVLIDSAVTGRIKVS